MVGTTRRQYVALIAPCQWIRSDCRIHSAFIFTWTAKDLCDPKDIDAMGTWLVGGGLGRLQRLTGVAAF